MQLCMRLNLVVNYTDNNNILELVPLNDFFIWHRQVVTIPYRKTITTNIIISNGQASQEKIATAAASKKGKHQQIIPQPKEESESKSNTHTHTKKNA